MTDTPEGFRKARQSMRLSYRQLGEVIKLDPTTVRRYEMSPDKSSHRDIPGPVGILMDWLANGIKPKLPKVRRGQ